MIYRILNIHFNNTNKRARLLGICKFDVQLTADQQKSLIYSMTAATVKIKSVNRQ